MHAPPAGMQQRLVVGDGAHLRPPAQQLVVLPGVHTADSASVQALGARHVPD